MRAAMKLKQMSHNLFETAPPPADERIYYGPHPLNFGDLRLPAGEGPCPTIIVIHGGFWRARYTLEHIGHLCAALTREGFATWSIEYRRIGDEGGAWPGTFLDVGRGVDHVRDLAAQYNLDLDRVTTIGHSAGGHLALWAAARHKIAEGDPLHAPDPLRPKAAISLAGVTSLQMAWEKRLSGGVVRDLMIAAPEEAPQRYMTASPIEMLPLGIRQVLIHGTEDENVPFELSQAYEKAATRAGDSVELVTLKGAGHFEVVDPKQPEWEDVLGAVKRET